MLAIRAWLDVRGGARRFEWAASVGFAPGNLEHYWKTGGTLLYAVYWSGSVAHFILLTIPRVASYHKMDTRREDHLQLLQRRYTHFLVYYNLYNCSSFQLDQYIFIHFIILSTEYLILWITISSFLISHLMKCEWRLTN